MTTRSAAPIVVLLLSVWAQGCARYAPAPPPTRPDVASTQGDVRDAPVLVVYHRTGGIAGTDDRIVLWSDGLAQVTGRMMRTTVVNLPADQMAQIRSILEGWERLESPPPSTAADAFVVEIFHDGKSVVVSDGATRVPRAFTAARSFLESLER